METTAICVIFLITPLLSSPIPTTNLQSYSNITNSSSIHNLTDWNFDNSTEYDSLEEEIYELIPVYNLNNSTMYFNDTLVIVKGIGHVANDTQNSTEEIVIETIRWKRDIKPPTARAKRNFKHNPVLQG